MKLTVIKQLNNSLKVAYNSDYELVKKLKLDTAYQCEIKRPRNYKFHKKYFALLNMLFENQERYSSIDHLRYDLTIEAGKYTIRKDLKGDMVNVPDSISFANMNELEFEDLYSKTLDVIVKYFNFNKQDIIDNVEQYF